MHMQHRRPRTLVAMGSGVARRMLTEPVRERLAELADGDPAVIATELRSARARAVLADAEVLFTSWGCPPLTEEVLVAAPGLRAVVHAAGSVKPHVTDACWARGIRVSSAATANAIPVAEYTVAAILFANKRVFQIAAHYRRHRQQADWEARFPGMGNLGKTVGIVGASRVGRRVIELLRPFDLRVVLTDPYLNAPESRGLDAALVSLDELLSTADVVSVHAPALPETHHLIDAPRLALMRDGATLINTARASLIDQKALTAELASGRLYAVLDVTEPETLPADSVLYDLPNVVLTPHIAGSLGGELARMANSALDELNRYARGLPFAHPITREDLARSA
jgi:phosphoglycerate dehydrogenase-like enzyme